MTATIFALVMIAGIYLHPAGANICRPADHPRSAAAVTRGPLAGGADRAALFEPDHAAHRVCQRLRQQSVADVLSVFDRL